MDGLAWPGRTALVALQPRSIQVGRARPPNAVSGSKLGPLITDFARFINSEIALLCGGKGQPPTGNSWSGLGHPRGDRATTRRRARWPRAASSRPARGPRTARPSSGDRRVRTGPLLHKQMSRSHEGGVVGQALGARRVALGPRSRGRHGLGRVAPHDGVGDPATDSQRLISLRIPGCDDARTQTRTSVRSHSSRVAFLPQQRHMLRCSVSS
jgi:hypothetical protein